MDHLPASLEAPVGSLRRLPPLYSAARLLSALALPQPLPRPAVSCGAASLLIPPRQDRAGRPSLPASGPATRELVCAIRAKDSKTVPRPFSSPCRTTPSAHRLQVYVRLPPILKSAPDPHAPVQAI